MPLQELLGQAGFKTAADSKRGFDHGTFIPMMMAFPTANIPTIQLSLKASLSAKEHVAIGRALQPLRDEGVYIIASGEAHGCCWLDDDLSALADELGP